MNTQARVLTYTKKYWKRLTAAMITASLFGIAAAAPTYILKQTIDELFVNKYSHLMIPFILMFITVFALKALFMYLTSYNMNWVGTKVVNDIRHDLFSKIINFPISFFQRNTTGQLMAHFLNDIQMIQNGASIAIKDGIRSFFEAIFLLGFAFAQNWKLACIMIIMGPLIGFVIKKMGRRRKIASTTIQKEMGSISTQLSETITGIRDVKAFNGEAVEQKRFFDHLHRCFNSIMHNVHIEALAPAVTEMLAVASGGMVLYVAVNQVLAGAMTAGQLSAVLASILLSYHPLKKLSSVHSEIQYSLAAAERIFALMDQDFNDHENRNETLTHAPRVISFENISFGYDDRTILNEVTLKITHGERIGIVGPSGVGKSTLCNLLLGFITPTHGKVLLDDKDISQLTLQSLRAHIGYVGQTTFLFNDTIEKNIKYGAPQATHEQVVAACKTAHAHEFISQLPEGYQTMVGENGTRLSGGQKQRLTIARALLKDPAILIFDEATSALDQESEMMIRLAIQEIGRDKTMFIVSHRPEMLEGVDRILSIEGKRILQKVPQEKMQAVSL